MFRFVEWRLIEINRETRFFKQSKINSSRINNPEQKYLERNKPHWNTRNLYG